MWIYLPKSLLSACAPELADSTWESDSLPNTLASQLASSVMSRSKPMRPAYWRSEWKKATSPLRRFGPTLKHSQASLGSFVARFTASLPDIHVSPFPRPASAEAFPIHDTFSRTFDVQSAQSSLFSVSSRMCADTCRLDSTPFRDAYDAMVTELSQEYSARAKSAQAIGGSDCSFWPTAKVQDTKHATLSSAEAARHEPVLAAMVTVWPTPDTQSGGRASRFNQGGTPLQMAATDWQTPASDSFRSRGGDRKDEMGLDQQARFWATPNTHDGRRPGVDDKSTQGANLNREASQWPTPANRDYKGDNSELHATETGGGRKHLDQLPNFVTHIFLNSHRDPTTMRRGKKLLNDGPNLLQQWKTPHGIANTDQYGKTAGGGGEFAKQATSWPTPTVLSQAQTRESPTANQTGGTTLAGLVQANWPTPRAEMDSDQHRGEPDTLHSAVKKFQPKKKLNPNFVDWLMGFQPGWSSVLIDFGPEEMQSYRSAQLQRLSRLLENWTDRKEN